jgi:hypothetical protein
MIDQNELVTAAFGPTMSEWLDEPLLFTGETFTRSNGTIMARIYERLTKASRRRDGGGGFDATLAEEYYRQGVYDAFKALQQELEQ